METRIGMGCHVMKCHVTMVLHMIRWCRPDYNTIMDSNMGYKFCGMHGTISSWQNGMIIVFYFLSSFHEIFNRMEFLSRLIWFGTLTLSSPAKPAATSTLLDSDREIQNGICEKMQSHFHWPDHTKFTHCSDLFVLFCLLWLTFLTLGGWQDEQYSYFYANMVTFLASLNKAPFISSK